MFNDFFTLLELRWVNPAFAGWMLMGISLSFFIAAINTMAGWLYLISGASFAILALSIILTRRALLSLKVSRPAIDPVSAGDLLTIEINIENQGSSLVSLFRVIDPLPPKLAQFPVERGIDSILPYDTYRLVYYHPTVRRGVYHWKVISLKTAFPLGLLWYRINYYINSTAIVYPQILPLSSCPLVDHMGDALNQKYSAQTLRAKLSTEGITRTLREYRRGDSTRLIHWRTSARYDKLQVRELENFMGGQDLVIGLDTLGRWDDDYFEQAVIVAASLYFYAQRLQINAKIWTAATGLIWGNRVVLETLAATHYLENKLADVPVGAMIWLTQNFEGLDGLPEGSRYVLWGKEGQKTRLGLVIQDDLLLQNQLQYPLS